MEFFEPCVPPTTTAQQKRVNHKTGVFFKSKEAGRIIETYGDLLRPHIPDEPMRGPLKVTIEVTWPWLKRHYATKAKAAHADTYGRLPHTSAPDCDNFCKQLIDEMARWLLIENDQCISDLRVRKFWGARPGIYVKVTQDVESVCPPRDLASDK